MKNSCHNEMSSDCLRKHQSEIFRLLSHRRKKAANARTGKAGTGECLGSFLEKDSNNNRLYQSAHLFLDQIFTDLIQETFLTTTTVYFISALY